MPVAYNAGIGGNTTAQMLARLSTDVLAHSPTDVTIMGGTNDLGLGVPLATSLANLGAIMDGVRAAGAAAWLVTIPPRFDLPLVVETYNAALPALAAAHGARLIDVWPLLAGPGGLWLAGYAADGIHPDAVAATIIAGAIQGTLVGYFEVPLTGNVDNWNPPGLTTATTLFVTPTGDFSISGLAIQPAGTFRRIVNCSNLHAMTLRNYNSESAERNKFLLGADKSLSGFASADLVAGPMSQYWYSRAA